MFKNYFKISYRNLLKHKGYSFINISGLAIGLTCCILIFLYVQDELSFDNFHKKADRIYRLNKIVTPQSGGIGRHAITSGQMGPTLVRDYPEVQRCVRMLPWFSDVLMHYGEKTLKVSDVVFADSTFFDVFDFKLIEGNSKTALAKPLSIVISEETAYKFFGDRDPLGETIVGFRKQLYTVTGIIENVPHNSHLRYNALISWSSTIEGVGPLEMSWLNNWLTQVAYTYLLVEPGANAAALQQKLPDFMQKYFSQKADQYTLYLQPFNEIYLQSGDLLFTRGLLSGSQTYVYVFSFIAVLILLIACINFMNLSTARATQRIKEVGVRKVVGANYKQLTFQFLGESFLFSLLAIIIAFVAVTLVLPEFNSFTGKNLTLNAWNNLGLSLGLPLLTIAVGFIAGTYPAILLAGFPAVSVLKGTFTKSPQAGLQRKFLVTLQFTIAISLITCTIVANRQMVFTQEKDLGFSREQIVVLPIGNTKIADQYDAFKNTVLQNPGIISAAGCNSVPGENMMSFGIEPEGKPGNEDWTVSTIRLDDYDLLKTYGMEMVSGRFFSEDFSTDATNGVVINETLAEKLGWKDAVGKKLNIPGELEGESKVIGVIKDFHMKSLHYPIEPMLFYFAPRYGNLAVRIKTSDVSKTINFLQNTWHQFDPQYPFEYYFLDEKFARLYASDQQMMDVFGLFSILAVFIAGLGLFGLATFMARNRTKEIGIRKVLGASVTKVTALLSKDFIKLVLWANAIAWPLAGYVMHIWLQDFAYRIEMSWWFFILSGGIALLIALITVSFQAIKAAVANPVESLRYE